MAWKIHHFRWINKNGKFQRVNIREATTVRIEMVCKNRRATRASCKRVLLKSLKRGFIQIGYRLTLMQASSITIGGKVEWARNVIDSLIVLFETRKKFNSKYLPLLEIFAERKL